MHDERFALPPAPLRTALGPMLLGVVDAERPGVADGISRLLFRSIADARASVGGHLPDWLVRDIERNYISPEKVRGLWAPFGHRFVVATEADGEIVATIHIARQHDTIFTINRDVLNVSASAYPGFKPERHHHVVNISVKHELRRAHLATAMVDGIVEHFRHLFDGDGLWVRADPPWHAGLVGLGFVHDPRGDIFLPETVERTAGIPHADFNARYACSCAPQTPEHVEAMRTQKLQYVSLARPFAARRASVATVRAPALADDPPTLDRYAQDWGKAIVRRPRAVARPESVAEVVGVLRHARRTGARVVVRGNGQSTGGQALGADAIVLSTERLSRIGPVGPDRISAEAGARWDDVLRASAPRLPPVVTGWLPATVGGTLSSGGVGKGSHRRGLVVDHVLELDVVTGDGRLVRCSATDAAWLFDAALGGLGQVGVIVRATVAVGDPPAPFVRVDRMRVDTDALQACLDDAAADARTFHVTAYREGEGDNWVVVCARCASDEGTPLAEYVAPTRPAAPGSGPVVTENAFTDARQLARVLRSRRAVQVAPVHMLRTARPTLLQTPEAHAYLVCFGDAPGGDHEATKTYMTAALPEGDAAWRAHLGAAREAFVRAKTLADPDGILGAPLPVV